MSSADGQGRVAGLADGVGEAGGIGRAGVDLDPVGGQFGADFRGRVDVLHGPGDGGDAVAAGHVVNGEGNHGGSPRREVVNGAPRPHDTPDGAARKSGRPASRPTPAPGQSDARRARSPPRAPPEGGRHDLRVLRGPGGEGPGRRAGRARGAREPGHRRGGGEPGGRGVAGIAGPGGARGWRIVTSMKMYVC